MFLNNLNYHLAYRNLLKNVHRSRLTKSSSSLFTNESKNITSQHAENQLNEDDQADSTDLMNDSRDLMSELDKEQVSKFANLTSYLEMIRESKRNVDNTYLFIFTDKRNAIRLPAELNSKNFDYFTLKNKEMCLIDLDCSKQTVDSIFQSKNEDQLGHNRFYHIKGPFLSSKLISDGERTANEIKFQNYNKTEINFRRLKQLSNVEEQIDFLCEQTKISDLERRIKFTIINYLERNICRGVFDNFELVPFGSSFTGLGFSYSDLDLVLLPKPMLPNCNSKELNQFVEQNNLCYLYKSKSLDKRMVNGCLSMIKSALSLMPGIEPDIHIHAATVPIVKTNCPIVNIEMDISMTLKSQNNGVLLMTQTLYTYCNLFPNLRKLYVVLRLWASQAGIIQHQQPSTSLKNFTFLMLLINFLQNHSNQLLPSMHAILTGDQASIEKCLKNNQNLNLVEVIPEFFKFLILTDFQRNGLDVYNGKFTRNFSLQPMFIKNPFDIEVMNMARNMIRKSVTQFKNQTKPYEKAFDPTDLSRLYNQNKITIPDLNQ